MKKGNVKVGEAERGLFLRSSEREKDMVIHKGGENVESRIARDHGGRESGGGKGGRTKKRDWWNSNVRKARGRRQKLIGGNKNSKNSSLRERKG